MCFKRGRLYLIHKRRRTRNLRNKRRRLGLDRSCRIHSKICDRLEINENESPIFSVKKRSIITRLVSSII